MAKTACRICGEEVHVISKHLKEMHPEMSTEDYQAAYPDAPLYSAEAMDKIQTLRAQQAEDKQEKPAMGQNVSVSKKPLHEVFGIPSSTKGVMTEAGNPIPIGVLSHAPAGYEDFIPRVDPNYIFQIDTLKIAVMGIECDLKSYLVGHAGTGKSTLWEQICAHTKRAMLRIQHTVNTEESHILGQYVAKQGSTVWEPGPLQICMKEGLVYLADEYDRAMPQVLSVYQPVLEGKSLVTKEAPPEWRVIHPHPNFRFVATGNTNGSGDETGLYPSTAMQDFANYERFSLMVEVGWMSEVQETNVVAAQAGIPQADAKRLVKFANDVRKQVDSKTITSPVSPRALIGAATIGFRVKSFRRGLQYAYLNRLNSVDKHACDQLAQRHFGND